MQAAKTKVEDGMAYTIKEGDYRQYGASAAGGGVVFTFEAEKGRGLQYSSVRERWRNPAGT